MGLFTRKTNAKTLKEIISNSHSSILNLNGVDEYFYEAGISIIQNNRASIGMLQRIFKIGFNRAANIMDQLCEYGVVGQEEGTKPRGILMDITQFEILVRNFSHEYPSAHQRIPSHSETISFDNMDGHDFEYFCADLLRQNGFINVEVTPASGDHGIDIFAEKDDITYAIQCKCNASNIGNSAVQQAHTGKSLYHRDIAVVMTNQLFTKQAEEDAKGLNVKLWDRNKLYELVSKAEE